MYVLVLRSRPGIPHLGRISPPLPPLHAQGNRLSSFRSRPRNHREGETNGTHLGPQRRQLPDGHQDRGRRLGQERDTRRHVRKGSEACRKERDP